MAAVPPTPSWDFPLNPAFQQLDWTWEMELEHVSPSTNTEDCNTETHDEDISVPDVFTSLDEIIAGLFLSCEQAMYNRQCCQNHGIALVLTLNGQEHTAPFRVYEYSSELSRCIYRKIASLQDFASELDAATRACSSETPVRQRKVFLRSVTADDMPIYDISQHFTELCALIEIVLRNRRQLVREVEDRDRTQQNSSEKTGNAESSQPPVNRTWLPSVGVHCLAGVSRSTTVVAAYLMKRSKRPAAEVLAFIRATRSIVSPNPGFCVQLEQWHAIKYRRIASEHDAALIAHDVSSLPGVDIYVHDILPYILKAARCTDERHFFGLVLRRVSSTHVQRDATLNSIILSIRQQVEEEVYTDVPYFFSHVIQVFCGTVEFIPKVMHCVIDQNATLVSKLPGISVPHMTGCWTDTLWWFTVLDFSRLSAKGEVIFAAGKITTLLNVIAAECPPYLMSASADSRDSEEVLHVSPPEGVMTSLPFLFIVAACSGDVIDGPVSSSSPPTYADIRKAFLEKTHSGFGAVASTVSEMKTLTSHPLHKDIEFLLFCSLTGEVSKEVSEILANACRGVRNTISQFNLTGRAAEVCVNCVHLKLVSGILAARLLFDAAATTRTPVADESSASITASSIVNLLKELDRTWKEQSEDSFSFEIPSCFETAALLLRAADSPICTTLAGQISAAIQE